jgi:hypothetical protein
MNTVSFLKCTVLWKEEVGTKLCMCNSYENKKQSM